MEWSVRRRKRRAFAEWSRFPSLHRSDTGALVSRKLIVGQFSETISRLLLPCGDVKANGTAGEIDTNVVLVARLDGMPCGEVCTGWLIQFVLLAS